MPTSVILRLSERSSLQAELDAPPGETVTLSSATWTLYDTNQQPITGFVDQPLADYDTDPVEQPEAVLSFKASEIGITPGLYELVILLIGDGSDGRPRERSKNFLLTILPDSL